jgi:murein DD-endopeptidase MepM/ murein hydrolase activator NlpD
MNFIQSLLKKIRQALTWFGQQLNQTLTLIDIVIHFFLRLIFRTLRAISATVEHYLDSVIRYLSIHGLLLTHRTYHSAKPKAVRWAKKSSRQTKRQSLRAWWHTLRFFRYKIINHKLGWLKAALIIPISLLFLVVVISINYTLTTRYSKQSLTYVNLPLPKFSLADNSIRYWREEKLADSENLVDLLRREGMPQEEITHLLNLTLDDEDLLKTRLAASISIYANNKNQFFGLRYLNDSGNGDNRFINLEKDQGVWRLKDTDVETISINTLQSIRITEDVTQSLLQAKLPQKIRLALVDLFDTKLAINSLQVGDSINLVYEVLYFNGTPLNAGNILSAEIIQNGQVYQAFLFNKKDPNSDNNGVYYDDKGLAMKSGFVLQPIANPSISSSFGVRVHPVTRQVRMHNGVDFRGPIGTPILAPGDGVIITRERQRGYGNMIKIRHNGNINTLYGHMSGFNDQFSVGSRVKAGEVIGYLGNTGLSTGPHLHFEVHLDGEPVDPVNTALPSEDLSIEQLKLFFEKKQKLLSTLLMVSDHPADMVYSD